MSGAEVIALALCLAAMLLLSQAMDRHCSQVLARAEPGWALRALLRVSAVALMALAWWHCLRHWGAAVGTVAWFGWLSLAALAVAWLLVYAPRGGAALVALAGAVALAWSALHALAA